MSRENVGKLRCCEPPRGPMAPATVPLAAACGRCEGQMRALEVSECVLACQRPMRGRNLWKLMSKAHVISCSQALGNNLVPLVLAESSAASALGSFLESGPATKYMKYIL